MTYQELNKKIDEYRNGQRKRVKPVMPKYCKVEGLVFKWSPVYIKYFSGKMENRGESRMSWILKAKGYDLDKLDYTLYD